MPIVTLTLVPLTVTADAPVRFVPVMVTGTTVPRTPELGAIPLRVWSIDGGCELDRTYVNRTVRLPESCRRSHPTVPLCRSCSS